ncbi:MAG: toprim domain-containing protein [bacterium]|nr:toprim domain-containing protein [bacterium]
MIPKAIQELADSLAHLPGIGPRQALRIAFYLARGHKTDVENLSSTVAALKTIKACADCFLLFEVSSRPPSRDPDPPLERKDSVCSICSDKKRESGLIAIVEKETDLISLEKARAFNGKYLVIGELKKDGILEQSHRLRLAKLKERITHDANGNANEIIIALSPTTYGDIQASVLQSELNGLAKKITRLGRGIPTGGEIEFADEDTLSQSLKNRG